QIARRRAVARLDHPVVPCAVARHLARAQRPFPADLSLGMPLADTRRHRARLCRQPTARGLDRRARAVRDSLLLHPFPDPDAAARKARAAAPVAAQHGDGGARSRRRRAGGEALTMRATLSAALLALAMGIALGGTARALDEPAEPPHQQWPFE